MNIYIYAMLFYILLHRYHLNIFKVEYCFRNEKTKYCKEFQDLFKQAWIYYNLLNYQNFESKRIMHKQFHLHVCIELK
jgi:hypothetical protein